MEQEEAENGAIRSMDCRLYYQLVQDTPPPMTNLIVNELNADDEIDGGRQDTDDDDDLDRILQHYRGSTAAGRKTETTLAEEIKATEVESIQSQADDEMPAVAAPPILPPDLLISSNCRKKVYPDLGILRLMDRGGDGVTGSSTSSSSCDQGVQQSGSSSPATGSPPKICDMFPNGSKRKNRRRRKRTVSPVASAGKVEDTGESSDRTCFEYDLNGDHYDELLPSNDDDWSLVVSGTAAQVAVAPTRSVDLVVRDQPAASVSGGRNSEAEDRMGYKHGNRKLIVQRLGQSAGGGGICPQVAQMCSIM